MIQWKKFGLIWYCILKFMSFIIFKDFLEFLKKFMNLIWFILN